MQARPVMSEHMEKLLNLIAETPECEIDNLARDMGVLALGTIRGRKGRKFLKEFCRGACDPNSEYIEFGKMQSH